MSHATLTHRAPAAAELITTASASGRLVPLRDLARVRSGLVTRANAYFLVEELPFDQIPNRFRVTRRDHRTVAVIRDGKDTPHRIPRKHLRSIIKGPDSLVGPREIAPTDSRLVNIEQSPDQLRSARDNDTLRYIRRGETVNYSVSADKFKGGIPAKRSNIKSRKPYWYSLNVPAPASGRLVVPEHFDQRFIVTALPPDQDAVVIDKLYLIEPKLADYQTALVAALNSLLTWYQIELRGRTQLGEGVLEAKIPDLEGVLVVDPRQLSDQELANLDLAFAPIAARKAQIANEELQLDDRLAFDVQYLRTLGLAKANADQTRTLLARELREAIAERRTRTESVAELKAQRTPKRTASRAVDAFAARIVSGITPYPDPRHYLPASALMIPFEIAPFEGALTLGDSLFDAGKVFAGSDEIAATNDENQARFVRAVLTIDPHQTVIDVPAGTDLTDCLRQWVAEVGDWWEEFKAARDPVVAQFTDPALSTAVNLRALELAHASETPESPVPSGPSGIVSSAKSRTRRRRT